MTRRSLHIDFIADLCCPWCYVAWKALEKAIAVHPDIDVTRGWGVFMLRPDAPPEGLDRSAYLAKLFANQPERAQAVRAALIEAARDADAPLVMDAATVMPNTLDAHRLMHWASGQDRTADAADALFAAYFVDGRNLGDRAVLVDVARSIGLDPVLVADLLASDADWNRIAEAHNAAVEAGVGGVPVVLFNHRVGRQGANAVAEYARLIDALAA